MEWALPERWALRVGSWGPRKVLAALGLAAPLILGLLVWSITERSARTQAEGDLTLLDARIDAQAREIARREALQMQTETELRDTETNLASTDRKAGALQTELEMTTASLQAELGRLEEQAAELRGRIATLERRNQNLGENLSSALDGAKELEASLLEEREDAQATLDRERRQAEAVRLEAERQAKRLAAEEKIAKALAEKAGQSEATVKRIAGENQRLAINLDQAVRDRNREAAQREQSEQALSAAYAAVQAREHEIHRLKHENGKLAAQVAGHAHENGLLRRKLDEALRNASRQQKTIEDLQKANQALQAEVERLQRELAAPKRERKPGIPKNE